MSGLGVVLAAGLTVAAVLLALPAPAARRWRRRSRPAGAEQPGRVVRSWLTRTAVVVAALTAPVLAGLFGGGRGAALALLTVGVAATSGRLLVLHRRRSASTREQRAVAEAADVLAARLRAGAVPATALSSAAESCPVLAEAARAQGLGGDVATVWRAQARAPGRAGLLDLSRGWALAERSGASLTRTLEQVAEALRAEQSLQAVVGSELSAARASGKVMAALPVLGLGLGYALQSDPLGWLLAGPPGWGCLVAGGWLACAGVLWTDALAGRASRAGVR